MCDVVMLLLSRRVAVDKDKSELLLCDHLLLLGVLFQFQLQQQQQPS